ncbi:Na+/H+ antiporter NhaC family protein [Heyndrickxia sp. NPDC080065]|uniref:Na+/H+ antiporter NhaC family protein n=1 Tax=Heyndrickxia sp. NPDC080065 TaxID=3390568 RepID=UPI003CFFB5B1
MENTIYSLLPPLLAILMVIITRKVLLSLGVGIVAAALLLAQGNILDTLSILWEAVKVIFWADGKLNDWNIFMELFVIILGVVTAFITIIGGTRAFGEWAMKRVKTRAGAQIMAAIFGIVIFIDDYFNALAVGQVSRPITDLHRVSRAKLAYIIDSTSAPVCVIAPISSWGAYIIGIIGSVLISHGISDIAPLSAFLQMIPMNLYVWAALALVFIIAIRGVDFGPMKTHEERAITTGHVYDPNKTAPGELKGKIPISDKGTVGSLIWPLITLIIATVIMMLWTGSSASDGSKNLMTIFENADVAKSLFYGGIVGLVVTLAFFFHHSLKKKTVEPKLFFTGIKEGVKSMVPAILILIFAWIIVDLIGQLETGKYLARLVKNSNMNVAFLPFAMFVIAGIIAFATGTSWGSFGILLPIAGEISAVTDVSIILPTMAAVLAGAVFGDHCSPISDTTILSSTGAGSNHIDHVMTQLPYALLAAGMAGIGYLVIGITSSTIAGFVSVIVLLLMFTILMKKKAKIPIDENDIVGKV